MASDWDYGLEKDYNHNMEMMIKIDRSKYIYCHDKMHHNLYNLVI